MDERLNELFEKSSYLSDLTLIKKAYTTAQAMHNGQFRDSGEEYIIHPIEVAKTISDMHGDESMICASLLHDTLEDTKYTAEDLVYDFGEEVFRLVDGVTKEEIGFKAKKERDILYKYKLVLYSYKDIRVMIIKLSDRLHNMKTLEFKNQSSIIHTSEETMLFYAPIAGILGMNDMKDNLYDLSFKNLNEEEYNKALFFRTAILYLSDIDEKIESLKTSIEQLGLEASIFAEIDSVYDTYLKLMNNNYNIYRIYAVTEFKKELKDKGFKDVIVLTNEEYQRMKDGITISFVHGTPIQNEFEKKGLINDLIDINCRYINDVNKEVILQKIRY